MAPSLTQDSKPPKKANLLEDSGSDDEDGGAALAAPELKVNEEYARRFEHNKKREERQRRGYRIFSETMKHILIQGAPVEEKYKHSKSLNDDDDSDSESSSDDETEDEDGFLATEDLDAQISGVLSAIKNKDPRVKDKAFSFFQAQTDATPAGQKKDKPLFLKDYHREKILAGDVGASDDEDDAPPRTYVQEQAALKSAIVSEINNAAVEDDSDADSDGDFVRKKKPAEKTGADGIHPSRAGTVNVLTETDIANAERDPEVYLSNFMSSRAWLEDGGGREWKAFESDDNDDADDHAEEFEQAYNMRFEDPTKSNEVLRSYARDITNAKSVRRDELTGRKRQRQLEKERKEAEKAERREEKARLRRFKVEEAEDRLRKIRKVAGMSGKSLTDEQWLKFLDEDWEGDQWEKEMEKKFGDSYYAEAEAAGSGEDEDENAAEGSKKTRPKKPTWDDDIDINDIVPDFKEDEEPKFTLSDDEGAGEDGAEDDEGEDDSDAPPSKKRKTTKDHKKARQTAKAAARADRAKIEALIDSRLDASEDVLAPSSGRERRKAAAEQEAGVHFRYRETSPQAFGMTARDILLAPTDADLNKFAGLKKLATFRDAEKKRKDKKRLGKKARLREWRRETFGRRFERTGPVWEGFEDKPAAAPAATAEKEEGKEAQGEDDVQQKKKRKRSRGKKNGAAAVEAE